MRLSLQFLVVLVSALVLASGCGAKKTAGADSKAFDQAALKRSANNRFSEWHDAVAEPER